MHCKRFLSKNLRYFAAGPINDSGGPFLDELLSQKKLNELIIQGQQPIVETRGK